MTNSFLPKSAVCRHDGGGGNRTRVPGTPESPDLQGLPASVVGLDDLKAAKTAPILALDESRVGEIVLNLVGAAMALGHERALDTLSDYCHTDDLDELAFVRDVFTQDAAEVDAKWFHRWSARWIVAAHARELSVASPRV